MLKNPSHKIAKKALFFTPEMRFQSIHFGRKKSYNVVNMYATLLWTSLRFPKIDKPLVVYRFYFITSSEFNAYQI